MLGHVCCLWRLDFYPDSHGSVSFVRRLGRPQRQRLHRVGARHAAAVYRAPDVCHVLLPARAVGRVLVDVLIVRPAARLDGTCSELHCEPELSARGVHLVRGGSASFDSAVRAAALRQLCMQGEPSAPHTAHAMSISVSAAFG